jgi:hypothetical protein
VFGKVLEEFASGVGLKLEISVTLAWRHKMIRQSSWQLVVLEFDLDQMHRKRKLFIVKVSVFVVIRQFPDFS